MVNKEKSGEIGIFIAGATGVPSGSGSLVDIELTVNANAQADTETKLEFNDTEIFDELGFTIPVALAGGVVKVKQPGIKGMATKKMVATK